MQRSSTCLSRGPNQQILRCAMETRPPSSHNRGIDNQRRHLCLPVLRSDQRLLRNICLSQSFCRTWPLHPAQNALWHFLHAITDTCHSSFLGEMLGMFFLWCCDKRAPRTSHGLFRRAESVPSEWKPRVLSEYILMHLQPPTQAHKAIKPVTDKCTCRKVIKCKVLWRTAGLRGLLQGHALIYCLMGWWAAEAGGCWPPSVREITAF